MVAVGLKFGDWVAGSSGHEQYPFRGAGVKPIGGGGGVEGGVALTPSITHSMLYLENRPIEHKLVRQGHCP